MIWRPGPLVHPPPAEPVPPLSPSEVAAARGAEPWSANINLSPTDLMAEILDHLKRLRAEVATMHAMLDEHLEDEREDVKDYAGSHGDMTGLK